MTAPDLEELLGGAAGRVRSVRVELREWADPERTLAAYNARHPGAGREVSDEHSIPSAPYTAESRVWMIPPDRIREESEGAVTVQRGSHWWMRHPAFGEDTNDGAPGRAITIAETVRPWVDPAPVLALLELSVLDTAQVAGHPALALRATARDGIGADVGLAWLGFCADEWELLVHAQRGVVLGTTARYQGEPFRIGEAVEIAFDEPLDDSLFTLEIEEA